MIYLTFVLIASARVQISNTKAPKYLFYSPLTKKDRHPIGCLFFFSYGELCFFSRPTEEGVGFEPEARLNGDEARAKREKIRSIGHGSAIDDYIFEWANKSHLRNIVF